MKTKNYYLAASFILATLSQFSLAETLEQCGDILRYAARDISSQVTFSDQRKYYYQQLCKNSSNGFGLDYKDAQTVLGFSYSSKDDYCKAEQSFDTNTNYSRIDSNLVVRNALDSYVQCRALSKEGISTSVTMPPSNNPLIFSLGIKRTSSNPQTIQTVTIDPDVVSCSTQKNGRSFLLNKKVNDISYKLPNSEARWTMSCTRKNTSDTNGNKTYMPVQLIVTTTAGDLPIALSEMGLAASNWANDLNNRISGIKISMDRHGKKEDTMDIDSPNAAKDCNNNDVAYGFSTSDAANALDFWRCATINLVIPPVK